MKAQLAKAGKPRPKVIGIDEISIRKGHTYRIVVSDLEKSRPIWFGGEDRSEKSLTLFFEELGKPKSEKVRLAVMDMWKPFRNATQACAPQAAILYDKFHVLRHLGEALDQVRKSEYGRLSGQDRRFIKGQKYTLLSRWDNLSLKGRQTLKPKDYRSYWDFLNPKLKGKIGFDRHSQTPRGRPLDAVSVLSS